MSPLPLPRTRFIPIITSMVLLLAASVAIGVTARDENSAEPQAQGRRIEVLFLGHSSTHHNSSVFAPLLKANLAGEGFNFSYTESPTDLNAANLAKYDALIFYANHTRITPEQEKALMDWVAAGHGFLPLHAASFMFQNSEPYIALVGAQFNRHGTGVFSPTITNPTHPIMEGVTTYEAWDETYVHIKHNAENRVVLMERVDSAGREPWTWVRTHGRGRIFYTASGHDERVWRQPMFLKMIRNALLWSVDQTVKQQWERLQIQPLKYTTGEVPVPNYERRDPAPLYQEPLTTAEAAKHMQIPPGFELQLFASEPDIVNPIAMSFDERGRLWVVETVDYPNERKPAGEGNDYIKILEDTNNDGKADKYTVFADKLSIPTGIVHVNGGVVISQAPEFLFLKDTTGDGKADVRQTIMTGWGTNDTHAGPSNLKYGFDNMLWGAVGYAGHTRTVDGRQVRMAQAIYRFSADGQKLERIANFTNNTWGLGFNEENEVFGSTANNEHSVFIGIPFRYYDGVNGLRNDSRKKIDGHYAMHANTTKIRQVDSQGGFTAAAGHNIYTARAFPQEYWNRIALVNEPTGHVLHRAILEKRGAGYVEVDGWNLMASDDEWMAPVHAEVGPDGAVWVLDWYHFIIQHNPTPSGAVVAQGYNFQTGRGAAYETPLRNSRRGRIYRLAWKEAPAYRPMTLSKDNPRALVAALKNDNMFWRMTAQRLLVERGNRDVLPELYAIVNDKSVDKIGINAPAIHALWTIHGLGALDGSVPQALDVARGALTHPAPGVRRNAQMVLPSTQERLQDRVGASGVNDPDPSVQMAALLKLAELPASSEVGKALYEISKRRELLEDEWRGEALYIAASKHAQGFFIAYADEIGVDSFARLSVKAARGDLPTFTDMSAVDFSEAQWRNINMPAFFNTTSLGTFEGSVWFRKTVELPADAAGKPARLRLGRIDDIDITFVNGKRIGTRPNFNVVREYAVPESVLVAGRNVIAVRITNNSGRGGIQQDSLGFHLQGEGFHVDLTGAWRHRIEEQWQGRRPEVTASVPLAMQLLRNNSPVATLVSRDTTGLNGVNYGDFVGRGGRRGGGGGGAGAAAGAAGATGGRTGGTGAAAGAATTGAAAATTGRAGAAGTGRAGAAPPPPELPVLELALSVVPLQNKYDKTVLTAKPGQRVKLNFNNADEMQHNVVLIERNRLVDFEKELMAMLTNDPSALARGFIPDSRWIIESMPLVNARAQATMEFEAPSVAGDYPFVCTFPGHWLTMRGVLRVQ